jgi:hypothetical protein
MQVFDYKIISKQISELIYTTLFTLSEKNEDARYLVFTVDICNLGLVAISWRDQRILILQKTCDLLQ